MSAPDSAVPAAHPGVPRLADDYTAAAARRRLAFLAEATGVSPEHLGRYSFDPAVLAGNIENFVGVAQVPIGIAGPLLMAAEATTRVGHLHDIEQCLELLGCYGPGRVRKLAEIVAATVLCGEVSLGAAVVADEWVTAHERLGRNRP